MAELVFTVHSLLRYLVLLAVLAAIVVAAIHWARTGPDSARPQRIAMAAFVGLLDVQVLLGLVLLALWPYYPALIGHIFMMVLAAIVAHVGSIMARRREPGRSGAPLRVATAVLALVLMVGGIMAIQRPII
ncbi:MAG TPA: hypothetical protein VK929_12410 [Longimicrobiales bacterium]|nr:hypothetical protein [Longimicrobiales bacterium]